MVDVVITVPVFCLKMQVNEIFISALENITKRQSMIIRKPRHILHYPGDLGRTDRRVRAAHILLVFLEILAEYHQAILQAVRVSLVVNAGRNL